jgi:NADPH:quinone reductase-like Zn-dependent oxidoreductase
MKQIWITKAGAPSVLQVKEAADPTPARGQVRIRVKAAGINFADLMARVGLYPDAPPIPCVVGYEVAGVIDAVGPEVKSLTVGTRVFGMPRFGGYTDTLVIDEKQVFPLPERMSFEQAAALPVVYLTAHTMMLQTGALRPGMKVLIHSAAGGVGLAAIELGKAHGCVLFGTASKGKHELLRKKGLDHPLDSSAELLPQARAALASIGASGFDLVLDPVGGRSWKEGYELLDPCGRLVAFGMSAATGGNTRNLWKAVGAFLSAPKFSPMKLMDENKSVTGVNMGHLFDRLDILTPQFHALLALFEAGKIAPHVDRTFRFSEAPAAHQYLHDRKAFGKVLLVPDDA